MQAEQPTIPGWNDIIGDIGMDNSLVIDWQPRLGNRYDRAVDPGGACRQPRLVAFRHDLFPPISLGTVLPDAPHIYCGQHGGALSVSLSSGRYPY